jgi:hypothetical protein
LLYSIDGHVKQVRSERGVVFDIEDNTRFSGPDSAVFPIIKHAGLRVHHSVKFD